MSEHFEVNDIRYPSRTKGRQLAVNILYSKLLTGVLPHPSLWPQMWQESELLDDTDAIRWAELLIKEVSPLQTQIQKDLEPLLRGWRWDRLPLVDQAILLLATVEMKYLRPPISFRVVIDEYLEIAKLIGHEESAAFINGVLDHLAQSIPWQKPSSS